MLKAFRRLFFWLYLFTVPPLLACYLSQLITPATFWPLAFLGLAFPLLLGLQFAFLLLFVLLRSKALVIPVILILVGWGGVTRTFQLPLPGGSGKPKPDAIKVMTYNVRLFDIAHYWSGLKDQSEGVLSYIGEKRPDILCFQEFAIQEPGKFSMDYVKSRLDFLPYSAVEYNFTRQNRKHGLAIFSRYPIINSGHEHFEDTKNMMLFADLLIGRDTVRVYNNHLESIHFDRDELQWIDTTTNATRIPRDKVAEIVKRMKGAYIKRAGQADLVSERINRSPYEVIVCGDFNDTPVSYVTHKISKDLYDSFRSGGRWLGITFPNVKAPLRIDYILHSRKMVSDNFEIGRIAFSDHRPVSCEIGLH